MNIIFAISFICGLIFSILFAFPKYFLSKFNYKNVSHPDDYQQGDVYYLQIIFAVMMIVFWVLTFYTLSTLG